MPMSSPLKVIIVEDQRMFAEMLRGTLELVSDVRVAGIASTVGEARQLCSVHLPDLLILDLALLDGDGLAVAQHLLAAVPAAKVIILSAQARTFLCPSWLHSNLLAVIGKHDAFHELQRALAGLAAQISPASPPALALSELPLLSKREKQVFFLVGEGLSSRAISERTGLTEATVRTYRKRIARKLGTTGDQLVQRAIEYRVRSSRQPQP